MAKLTLFLSLLSMAMVIPDSVMSSIEQKKIIEGANKFALELYQAIRNTSKNIIVSPVSIQIVLAMVHQGAKGNTASEISRVLHLPENNEKALEGQKAMIIGLESPVMKLATKMFLDKSFNLIPNFRKVTHNYFKSDVEVKDFVRNSDKSRTEINSWAEENTNHKIKDLIPPGLINSLTRLVLVNAVHFKANWKTQFNKNLTHDMPFYVTPEAPVNVKMMSLRDKKLRFKKSLKLNAQIVEVPYSGNEFSMMIILPNKIDGLQEVENNLANVDLTEELSSLYETAVVLYMPRFKIEETMKLNEVLMKMGMPTAFSDLANFTGISNEGLQISAVLQKAFIEVNEEGTEAAAATAMVTKLSSAGAGFQEPIVICNKPFISLIIHKPTGAVVFVSRIFNVK